MTLSKLMPGVHYVTLNSNGNNVYLVLGKRAAFIDSGDGTDGDTVPSGKLGLSASLTDALGVYGEVSFVGSGSDTVDRGYGSKAGV